MKRFISLILLLLITINSGAYVIIYFQLSTHFKKLASEKINNFISDDELIVLKFDKDNIYNNNEITWFEGNEFLYHNCMYDIYKITSDDDYVYFYCISDENENILQKSFITFVNSNSLSDGLCLNIISIVKNLITIAQTPLENKYETIFSELIFNYHYIYNYHFLKSDIPSPPPKS